jgi:hypothetical protein
LYSTTNKVFFQPTPSDASTMFSTPSIASNATAVAPYNISEWERTTFYHGISPDPPELLYHSGLVENPFPIPKGRHRHVPTKTIHGVFDTPLNAVWDIVAPQIRDLLVNRKIPLLRHPDSSFRHPRRGREQYSRSHRHLDCGSSYHRHCRERA